jgi:hypothetical protein
MQFSITTEVDAPPEVVFAVLSEVERWPEWTPTTFAGLLGRVIGWMMRGLNKRYLAQEAAGLKRRSEERARGTL